MLDTAQAAIRISPATPAASTPTQLAGMTRTETEFNLSHPAARQIATADSAARVRDPSRRLGVAPGGRGGRGGGRGGFGGAQDFSSSSPSFSSTKARWARLRSGAGRYGDGTVAVQGGRCGPSTIPTTGIPNISIAAEHYGRMYRTIQKGIPVTLEVNAKVAFTPTRAASTSWVKSPLRRAAQGRSRHARRAFRFVGRRHRGDGQRGRLGDHARGDAYSENLNLPMKRTVRIGLWTGEEQGLIGSNAYVSPAFRLCRFDGTAFHTGVAEAGGILQRRQRNGSHSGHLRRTQRRGGSDLQAVARAVPRSRCSHGHALAPTTGNGPSGRTIVLGLPGFQFIQDEIDYNSRTHHTNMDLYERLVPRDLMQNAVIVAAFVYDAANRDEKLPRKPAPTGAGRGGRGVVP